MTRGRPRLDPEHLRSPHALSLSAVDLRRLRALADRLGTSQGVAAGRAFECMERTALEVIPREKRAAQGEDSHGARESAAVIPPMAAPRERPRRESVKGGARPLRVAAAKAIAAEEAAAVSQPANLDRNRYLAAFVDADESPTIDDRCPDCGAGPGEMHNDVPHRERVDATAHRSDEQDIDINELGPWCTCCRKNTETDGHSFNGASHEEMEFVSLRALQRRIEMDAAERARA